MRKIEFFEFELTGVALGVTLAIARFPGAPIVICCDNKGAIGTVIRGSCKTQLGRDISSYIWRIAAETGTFIWVEFVSPPLNISDEPSRCCKNAAHVNDIAKNAIRFELPKRFESAFKSRKALTLYGLPLVDAPERTCWGRPDAQPKHF